MTHRPLLSSLLAACALLHAQRAGAAEPEAVRLEVEGLPGCVDEAAVRAEVAELGGSFRDANLDDRSRVFRVEVARAGGRIKGRLLVRDLVFRENVREVNASDCKEATESVSLFIATALDEAPPPLVLAPAPITAPPVAWPAPGPDAAELQRRRGRVGSGGIAVTGFAGWAAREESAGFRAYATMRVGRQTRIGVAGAITHARIHRTNECDGPPSCFSGPRPSDPSHKSQGISQRAGVLVGWGAPWNDSVVGFNAELGAAWGGHRGFEDPSAGYRNWSFVSVYTAWQIVFQVPFNAPVRPIAAFGTSWVPNGPAGVTMGGLLAATAETGIVWQAW